LSATLHHPRLDPGQNMQRLGRVLHVARIGERSDHAGEGLDASLQDLER
jgi:hypothetical protein